MSAKRDFSKLKFVILAQVIMFIVTSPIYYFHNGFDGLQSYSIIYFSVALCVSAAMFFIGGLIK